MTTSSPRRRFLLLAVALGVASASGCGFTSTEGELNTFAGEWCTLESLGSDDLPIPGMAYVGATLIMDGNTVLGTGSTSRPGSDVLYPAHFQGNLTGDQAVILVRDLEVEPEVPGPVFTMSMHLVGARDMEGTMQGDEDFVGPVILVRLGPRCFAP